MGMISLSVTCHPTQVNAPCGPCLNPIQAGLYSYRPICHCCLIFVQYYVSFTRQCPEIVAEQCQRLYGLPMTNIDICVRAGETVSKVKRHAVPTFPSITLLFQQTNPLLYLVEAFLTLFHFSYLRSLAGVS